MAYLAVYPWIGKLLQDSARDVDEAWFDDHIRSAVRDSLPAAVRPSQTAAEFYDAMGAEDREAFDEAVGHLVAARTHGPLTTGGAGGSLSSEATETVKRAFAGAEAMREEWRARASTLLASCSFAPPTPQAGIAGAFFAAAGPTRTRRREREE